ncbi:MAG: uroporphyrinogen decarboxylase family protein [Cyclobacteriaceae bacterium]|nr:uroporphyrinogen decarboxylase family protein [Cyclobacteriaceae bacterium]
MTKKENLERLFAGMEITSKLFRPILMHFAARFNNHSYAEFASDHRVLVDCNIKAMDYFGMDMVGLISDPYRETSAFGADISFPEEAVPICASQIIRTFDDVKSLKNPDVYKNLRTRDRIDGAALYQKLLKGNVPVIGWIEGPLAEACDLTGVSQMLMQLMLDPDFSNILLDKVVVTAKEFARAQIEEGCDIIGIGDAICSQIDPDTYDLYIKKRHRELIDYIHEQGARVKLHICGNITHLLPSIRELGMDILDLDWQVDMDHAYEVVGPEVVRCGNIDPVLIQNRSEEQVRELTAKLIRKESGRRHILSAGCEITVNTPVENLLAMRIESNN